MGQQMNEKFCSFAKDSGFRKTSLERKNPIFYDHQYIHARTGYALSGFKKAIAICLDAGGMDNGECNSGGVFIVDDGNIQPIKYLPCRVSLGLAYGNQLDKDKVYDHIYKFFPYFKGMDIQTNGVTTCSSLLRHDTNTWTAIDTRLLLLKRLFKKFNNYL